MTLIVGVIYEDEVKCVYVWLTVLWLPPKRKIFVFRFSRRMEDEKWKIDFLHFWPNLGAFEGIFHDYMHLKIGMLEIKSNT